MLLLTALVGILLRNVVADTSNCNVDKMRECRADILEQLSGSSNSDPSNMEAECRELREKFDCVLWQTSRCLKEDEQDTNSDVIMKAWRYLGSFCEKYGNWWATRCFQRDDIKRCDVLLPIKHSSLDSESCRGFVNFRNCVISIAEKDCSKSDRKLLGSYMMEKGQEKAWRCSKNPDLPPLYPENTSLAKQREDQYPVYADAQVSTYEPCVVSSRNEVQRCLENFEGVQRYALRKDDSDMRNHQICCGLVNYEECVHNAIRRNCGNDLRRIVDTIVSTARSRWNNACRDHTRYTCSGSLNIIPLKSLAVYFLTYLMFTFVLKKLI